MGTAYGILALVFVGLVLFGALPMGTLDHALTIAQAIIAR